MSQYMCEKCGYVDETKDPYFEAKRKIKQVLDGELESVELDYGSTPPSKANSILNVLGVESQEDFETNGWQWDFWDHHKYNDQYFVLSGSGYYGKIKFGIRKD